MNEELNIEKKLDALRDKHRSLDRMIDQLIESQSADQLQLFRLKREKLALRDKIAGLEEQLYPDIIA